MINKTKILTCGTSLVGFRQDSNPMYTGLSAALKASTSGLYVNDLPAVNFEIVDANLSNDITAATYLSNVYESELLNLVNQFMNKSKQNFNSKELLSNQTIVSGVASMNNKVVQNERFVGYWLRPHRSNFMKIQITSLGFQATATQATKLKIFLYETSQLEAIKIFEFDITKGYSLLWKDVTDWILSYESLTGGTGQDYLIGYYEKQLDNLQAWQLQNQSLYMEFDCGCPGSPKTIYGKYLGIQPIEINKQNLNWNSSTNIFDIPLVDNVSDFVTNMTYGLIAKINVTCDITDVICSNIGLFARPLQHAIASRLLYDAYASTRINSISDSKREQAKAFAIKYDGILNGYTTPEGVRIKGLIDTLTVDFSALDSWCLPCERGITRGNLIR